MKKITFIYWIATAIFALPVFSEIYKCTGDDGVVRFSNDPCGEDAEMLFKEFAYVPSLDDLLHDITAQYKRGPKVEIPLKLEDKLIDNAKAISKYLFPDLQTMNSEIKVEKFYEVNICYGSIDKYGHFEYRLTIFYRRGEEKKDGYSGFRPYRFMIHKGGRSIDYKPRYENRFWNYGTGRYDIKIK